MIRVLSSRHSVSGREKPLLATQPQCQTVAVSTNTSYLYFLYGYGKYERNWLGEICGVNVTRGQKCLKPFQWLYLTGIPKRLVGELQGNESDCIDTLLPHPYNGDSSCGGSVNKERVRCRSPLSSPLISSASGNMDFGSA